MPISKRKIIMIIILLVTPIIIYLINMQRTKYYEESFSDEYMVKEYTFHEMPKYKKYFEEYYERLDFEKLLEDSLIPDKKNLVRIKNYTKQNDDGIFYNIEVRPTDDEKAESETNSIIFFNPAIPGSEITMYTLGLFRVVYVLDNKNDVWKPSFCTYGMRNYIGFHADYMNKKDSNSYSKSLEDTVFITSLNYPYNKIENANIQPTEEEKVLAKKAYLKSGGNKTYFDVMDREHREGKEFSTLSRIKAQSLVDKDEKELTSIKIKQPKFQNIIQSNLSDDLK